MLTKKINPCIRPLLANIYSHMPAVTDMEDKTDSDGFSTYALEAGSNLWQLYMNLSRLHRYVERHDLYIPMIKIISELKSY